MAIFRITLSFVLSLVGFTNCYAESSKVIRFSTAIIPPYQTYSNDSTLNGTAPKLINCISRKLGYDADKRVFPWARAQKSIETGDRDAFFVASQNSVRDTYAKQSKPLFSGTRSWYFRDGFTHKDTSSQEFKDNAYVGTVFGTNMHTKLKSEFQHVVSKTTEIELIELLNLGRLDAILLTNDMFRHAAQANSIPLDTFASVTAAQKPLGAYFGHHFLKKNPNFLERFNSNIEICKSSLSQ